MAAATSQRGRLTLIGSGELAPSMSRVHRAVAARIDGPPRCVFIDTPAGFEPNVDEISAKAVAYFNKHLGLPCDVASFRGGAAGGGAEAAARRIRLANYVFAGPGSPTYAARNWKDSVILDAIAQRLDDGAEVVLASAAAIAAGAYALPVYEIYKAGVDLAWWDGCDLLGPRGYRLAIVPHWNNAEGSGYDTRFCYMGEERFEALRAMLDPTVVVLGLDEYTACALDFEADTCEVIGAGVVTVLRGDEHAEYGAGERFPLRLLRTGRAPAEGRPARAAAPDALARTIDAARQAAAELTTRPVLAAAALLDLAETIETAPEDGALTGEGRAALEALITSWAMHIDHSGPAEQIGPYVQLLIEARQALRAAKAFDAADAVRDGLAAHGIVLEDGREGTSWRRA